MTNVSDAVRLEGHIRAVVMSVVAIGLLALANCGYRASSFYFADASWKNDAFYKEQAVEVFAGSNLLQEPVGPAIAFARTHSNAATADFIRSNPSLVAMGKVGYSDWSPTTFWQWWTGKRTKVVSMRRGTGSLASEPHYYATLTNCGATPRD